MNDCRKGKSCAEDRNTGIFVLSQLADWARRFWPWRASHAALAARLRTLHVRFVLSLGMVYEVRNRIVFLATLIRLVFQAFLVLLFWSRWLTSHQLSSRVLLA